MRFDEHIFANANSQRKLIRRFQIPSAKRNSTKQHGLITFQGEDKMEKLRTTSAGVTELLVDGMTCQNCARNVTEAIQSAPGVHSAAVSLENMRATVRWNPKSVKNVSAVVAAIKKAGYEAKEIPAGATGDSALKQGDWQLNLWLGLAVTAALMIGEWGFGLAMTPWFQWLAFVLAGVVQIFCGAQFYRGMWRQLKVGSTNMDTLVALGSTTAFSYSTWALLSGAGGHVYFMEAAAIISLITAGHWLEARVSESASGALKSLLNLAPQTARRIQNPANQQINLKTTSFSKSEIGNRKSEIEVEVPVSELIIGDRIVLRPGDRVPVDGVVLEGESAVDEAMLTGESVPVDKKSGSELFAGYSECQWPPRHARHRHRRSHRARAHHRRRATRTNQPRRHPAPRRPHQQYLCSHCRRHRACRRNFLGNPFRRGKSLRHRIRNFDCRLPVRDGFGHARRHHGRRQRRRPPGNSDPRRRGFGKIRQNHGGDF